MWRTRATRLFVQPLAASWLYSCRCLPWCTCLRKSLRWWTRQTHRSLNTASRLTKMARENTFRSIWLRKTMWLQCSSKWFILMKTCLQLQSLKLLARYIKLISTETMILILLLNWLIAQKCFSRMWLRTRVQKMKSSARMVWPYAWIHRVLRRVNSRTCSWAAQNPSKSCFLNVERLSLSPIACLKKKQKSGLSNMSSRW